MNEKMLRALDDFRNHWDGKANQHWLRVFRRAELIFIGAGCGYDFCLQSVGGVSVVFGGSNRLIWDKRKNEFRASESHCSESFIRSVEEIQRG